MNGRDPIDPTSFFDFSGREVLVIGASRGGIGSAIAAAFRATGAGVRITGAEPEPVEADRGRYPYVQLDVTDADAVDRLTARGTVINIASMYASFGSPKNPAYGASKAAVQMLTKSLAIAWAESGIRVNAVAPGFIITEQSAPSGRDPTHVAAVEARTPLGRWGQPEDIAGPVLFLASPAAAFVTGTILAVDGGYSVK